MMPPLLIVDVQRGFINDATRHIPALVEALAGAYGEVFVSRFVNPPGSAHRRLIHWDRFAPGSADTELAFTPPAGAVVFDKSGYSCIGGDLLRRIRATGAGQVDICGIATDNCILCTAVDLFDEGLRPVVLAEACASHGGEAYHLWGLRILRRLIGPEQIRGGPE